MRITIIWLFLGLFSSEALACRCASWALEDRVFKADSIYIGTVTEAEIVNPKKGNKQKYVEASLKVLETLKGKTEKNTMLKTSLGSCGIKIQIAQKYLIFSRARRDWINTCSGSRVIYRKYEEELKELINEIIKTRQTVEARITPAPPYSLLSDQAYRR